MAEPPDTGPGPGRVRPWYLVAFFGSILGMFALFYGGLFALAATGNLPPPAFTNSICVDEKLAFLRREQPEAPSLLVIGSSVAWRHFDGQTVTRRLPGTVPLNGAFCGQTMDQTAFSAAWLLDRYPTARDVLLIVAPQDFDDCSAANGAYFDREDVDDYVFDGASPWPYYTRYFSLESLVRNASGIAAKRSGANQVDPLVFDRYGSGPLDSATGRGAQFYGKVAGLDADCFTALSQLGARLAQEGRHFMVASTPLHPEWKATQDPQGLIQARFNAGIRKALLASGGEYWDSNQALSLDAGLFFDSIHLRWSGVPRYTDALIRALLAGRHRQAVHVQVAPIQAVASPAGRQAVPAKDAGTKR